MNHDAGLLVEASSTMKRLEKSGRLVQRDDLETLYLLSGYGLESNMIKLGGNDPAIGRRSYLPTALCSCCPNTPCKL